MSLLRIIGKVGLAFPTRWGRISGDISDQKDLIEVLENLTPDLSGVVPWTNIDRRRNIVVDNNTGLLYKSADGNHKDMVVNTMLPGTDMTFDIDMSRGDVRNIYVAGNEVNVADFLGPDAIRIARIVKSSGDQYGFEFILKHGNDTLSFVGFDSWAYWDPRVPRSIDDEMTVIVRFNDITDYFFLNQGQEVVDGKTVLYEDMGAGNKWRFNIFYAPIEKIAVGSDDVPLILRSDVRPTYNGDDIALDKDLALIGVKRAPYINITIDASWTDDMIADFMHDNFTDKFYPDGFDVTFARIPEAGIKFQNVRCPPMIGNVNLSSPSQIRNVIVIDCSNLYFKVNNQVVMSLMSCQNVEIDNSASLGSIVNSSFYGCSSCKISGRAEGVSISYGDLIVRATLSAVTPAGITGEGGVLIISTAPATQVFNRVGNVTIIDNRADNLSGTFEVKGGLYEHNIMLSWGGMQGKSLKLMSRSDIALTYQTLVDLLATRGFTRTGFTDVGTITSLSNVHPATGYETFGSLPSVSQYHTIGICVHTAPTGMGQSGNQLWAINVKDIAGSQGGSTSLISLWIDRNTWTVTDRVVRL